MDSEKREQQFDAISMAIKLGQLNAARSMFEYSLNEAVNSKLDQLIRITEKLGLYRLREDIENMKETRKY